MEIQNMVKAFVLMNVFVKSYDRPSLRDFDDVGFVSLMLLPNDRPYKTLCTLITSSIGANFW